MRTGACIKCATGKKTGKRTAMFEWVRRKSTVTGLGRAGAEELLGTCIARAFRDSTFESSLNSALSAAVAHQPTNTELVLNYCRWLDGLSRNEQAIPLLERAMEFAPAHSQLALQLGWALAEAGAPESFGHAEKWLAVAEREKELRMNVADSRAWMRLRKGDFDTAWQILCDLPNRADAVPEIAYHRAAASDGRGDKESALFFLEQALSPGFPFCGVYDAMVLHSKLLRDRAPVASKQQEIILKVPTIARFHAEDNGLVISLDSGEVVSLSWDRIWELGDATPDQRRRCRLTRDRLGLAWPELRLALTSLHLQEAAMKGSARPEDRPLYGYTPNSWRLQDPWVEEE